MMTIDDLVAYAEGLGAVLLLRPQPGDGTPEIAWGDVFCYYAPDGVLPQTQPFTTVVTKDYPGEPSSGLDEPESFRVNVAPSRELAVAHRDETVDPTARDAIMIHPVYGDLGWLAVVDPGPRTDDTLRELIRSAHAAARERWERRNAART